MANTYIKAGQFSGVIGNGTDGYFLMSSGDGNMTWAQASTGPSVTAVTYPGDDTAADPAGGQTVVLTGTGFANSGMAVSIGGTTAPSVAHDSNTQLTITTPVKAAGDYDVVVTNTVTGASGTFVNGISYNGVPTWTTAAGSLGTFESETTISTITLQATEPDGGTITFNITNGALPTGLSLTGANIDGTTTAESSTTLYSFTIEAIDDENQATPRNFSITVNSAAIVSSENFTINTYTGNGSTQSIEGKIGTAASFNGSSSAIDLGSPLLGQTHSVSLWFNADYITTDIEGDALFAQYTSGNTGRYIISIYTNILRIFVGGSTIQTISATWTANAWTHLVIVKNSSGYEAFVNGSSIGTSSLTSNIDTASNTTIGAGRFTSPFQVFPGKIDQVRIFNTALDQAKVTTLYGENNASLTKSTTDIFDDGSGVALYEFEKGAIDTGGASGYIGGGGIFNGSSSLINLNSPLLNSTTYTTSLWIKPNSIVDGKIIYGQYTGGVSNRHLVAFGTAANVIKIAVGSYNVVNLSSSFQLGVWQHLVVTKSATDFKVYLDGQEVGSLANTTDIYTGANTSIGNTIVSPINGPDSSIDQVRIFNTALDSTKIATLAAETSASATKSTTDIFDDGSGVALYELEGNALDTDKGAIDSGQSAVFNGSSSKIDLPVLGLGGNAARSISAWVNPATTPSLLGAIYHSGGTNAKEAFIIYYQSDNKIKVEYDNRSLGTTTTISNNTWTHIVATYNGGSIESSANTKIYINGVLQTLTNSGGATGVANTLNTDYAIGYRRYANQFYFDGSIDQVRIYNTALSQSDVVNLASETNVPTANLVAHYKLDGNGNDETTNYNATSVDNITYSDPAEFPTYDGTATNVSYAYNGTATNVNYLGMAFQPDLVWIKDRDGVTNHYLTDSIRGTSLILRPNITNAEFSSTQIIQSFNSNGFSIGNDIGANLNGNRYVAWCWKGADTTTTIPAGTVGNTIASDVRANTAAGFSIVKYTGNGVAATVGHGLNTAPSMYIVKPRTAVAGAGDWHVYNSNLGGNDKILLLNSTSGTITAPVPEIWNNTSPTDTVFSLGTNTGQNNNGTPFIAYCFADVDGYQKIGSYSGGLSGSGNVIYTTSDGTPSGTGGFKPRFLLVKRTDISGDAWQMFDSIRGGGDTFDNYLQANEAYAEASYALREVNFTTNGFYWTNAESGTNISGGTYIYLAIA